MKYLALALLLVGCDVEALNLEGAHACVPMRVDRNINLQCYTTGVLEPDGYGYDDGLYLARLNGQDILIVKSCDQCEVP